MVQETIYYFFLYSRAKTIIYGLKIQNNKIISKNIITSTFLFYSQNIILISTQAASHVS